ncbi:hypothetical protein RE6C_04040 [Rhodopirellula europaea 6C]|uniref:Uncharacterized protein n=1 Tax=Rhodopirellula europaea 6C TaxID=1263867 RepID=M2B0E1_9BACT|nr:hypothetical protein RE6C_04040 [Rhodopirellula europaea 6C]
MSGGSLACDLLALPAVSAEGDKCLLALNQSADCLQFVWTQPVP